MAPDLEERRFLQQRLEEVLGAQAASALLAHLPSEASSDVATSADLQEHEELLELRLDRIHDKFAAVDDALATVEQRGNDRFHLLESRLDSLERRADDREASLTRRLDLRDDTIRDALGDLDRSIQRALRRQTTILVWLLAGVALVATASVRAPSGPRPR